MIKPVFLISAATLVLAWVPAKAQSSAPEEKTAAAVLAADDAWGAAEVRGDATFVDWLLIPDYRSVNPNGTVTAKAKIVAGAKARSGSSKAADMAVSVAAWKAAHPMRGDVVLFGDTAVLNWISIRPGAGEPVSSCDVFVYRTGHWHAIYSQHSTASV